MTRIRIRAGGIEVTAHLNDTDTARAIREALPLRGRANRWGEEIYFAIPVREPRAADARTEVEAGQLGYWPDGHALCIFFGPTPASTGPTPVAASPVNIVGRVEGDATVLRQVRDGDPVAIEAT